MQMITKLRRFALLMVGLVLSAGLTLAQERTVSGKVTAEGEGALPGVNITIQGTVLGVMTDINGGYSITVPGPGSVLVFSSIGYVTQAVPVGSQTTVDVVLVSDVQALSEVVVTGYTQQRRRDLTGSIATVEPAKLTAIPTGNVSNALQGRTSGLQVLGDGRPGETAKVRIRGYSSFENNDPLYVVDGVPTQDISAMNPNDVASISVLKDAGAASIYGSRASNGVIIVSTKKGSTGTKVNYSMYFGSSDPGKGPTNLLNTQEYAATQWLVYKNDQLDGTVDRDGDGDLDFEVHPIYGSSANASPTIPNWAGDTDWYNAITRSAMKMNHDLSLSGGTENAKFFAALGVYQEDGIVIHTDADKYTGRFNSEFSFLNGKIKVGENLSLSYRTGHGVANLNEGSPIQMASYRTQPIIPVIMTVAVPDGLSHAFVPGEWGGTGIAANLGQSENVVATLTRAKDNNSWNMHMIGSAFIDIKLFPGLNFKSTLGGTFDNGHYMGYSYKTYERSENNATNSFNEGSYYGSDWVWTNQLTFDKAFGEHKILSVLGYEAVKYGIGRGVSGNRASYFSDDFLYRTLSNGASIISADSYLNTPTTLVSQFIRADYSFRDKYMLSATVRRDGSSRFGQDNRYGIFPSFSVGWRVKDESFLTDVTWLSDLKLRGSYGTMGNQLAVSPQNQFYNYGGSPALSFYDINGTYTGSAQGFAPTRIGNPDAKWETNVTTDVGFEASFLNNMIGLKIDWYSKQTKDLLYNPELPGTAGAAERPYVNIASMSNKGLDMELTFRNTWGDFGFEGGIVLTTVNNKILKIAEGVPFFDSGIIGGRINGVPSRNMVDHPMSEFFGYKVLGLFQTAQEVSEAPTQTGAEPGFMRFQDTDGDRKITPADRTFVGSPHPDFTYGINLGFTYKRFDLTAFLYGSQGNEIFNWNTWWIDFWPSFQGQKSTSLLYDSWTPERTNATVPKASVKSNFSTNNEICDYYIEDGSFLRLKNLQLGYTFPETLLSKVNIKSLRLYVQGVNLFTITKYSGLDPEIGGNDLNFGADMGNYPLVRQYLVGLNVNF